MAKYSIQAPNGKTYEIDGPDGASQEDVQNEVLRQYPEAANSAPETPAQGPSGVEAPQVAPEASAPKMGSYETMLGKKKIQFQAPEGASDDEIREAAAKATGQSMYRGSKILRPEGKPVEAQQGSLESGLRGLGQGALFGFGDEAEAGVRSMFGGNSYDEELATARHANDVAAEQNPGSYYAGDVAGTVGSMFVPGLGVVGNAGRAVKGAGVASTLARGALSGAVAGGARGVGEGDGVGDRLMRGAGGAALGGAAGGAMGAGGAALGAAGRGANAAYSAVQNAGGNIVNNLSGRTGALARAVPGADRLIQSGAKGLADVADARADKWLAGLAQRSPKMAERLGNMYNSKIVGGGPGLVSRAAGAVATGGHNLAVEAGVRSGALAAEGAGALLGRGGAAGVAGSQVVDQTLSREERGAQVLHDPARVMAAAQGTRYEQVLREAEAKGPNRLKAVLFTLQSKPEFRRALGIDE
jgi:hypothetical protein